MREAQPTYFDRTLVPTLQKAVTAGTKRLPIIGVSTTLDAAVDNLSTNVESIVTGATNRLTTFGNAFSEAFPHNFPEGLFLFTGSFVGKAAKEAKIKLGLSPDNPVTKFIWGSAIELQPTAYLFGITRAFTSINEIMALGSSDRNLNGLALTALGATIALVDNLLINTDPKKEWRELVIGLGALTLATTGLMVSSPETKHIVAPFVITAAGNFVENLIEATKNI